MKFHTSGPGDGQAESIGRGPSARARLKAGTGGQRTAQPLAAVAASLIDQETEVSYKKAGSRGQQATRGNKEEKNLCRSV
jgi:hypothetical protein